MKRILYIVLSALLLCGCSTTRRLTADQKLYTGVKDMDIVSVAGGKVRGPIEAAVREPLSVKPNNPLISPYVRTPLPIGLWAYNAFYTERQTGFRAWMFRNMAKKPVLMSDVKPELRTTVVRDVLDNHGYFGSGASYKIIDKGSKKARVSYRVEVPAAWHYISVEFPPVTDEVTRAIDSLGAWTKVRVGDRYDVDTLAAERIRIANVLRNHAYYYFRPEYIEYLADTTVRRGNVALRMTMAGGTPQAALRPYSIGNVQINIMNVKERGRWIDTAYNGMKISYQKPLRVRPKIFRRTLAIAPGRPARVETMNQTLTRLNKLGIFRYVNLAVTPLDSLAAEDRTIDLTLSMAMDTPMDAEMEVDFSYLSSSFIGPKLGLRLNHKNFMRGGEVFSIKLNGGYEWQIGGSQGRGAINSYAAGVHASLMLPRVIAPAPIVRRIRNRFDNRTTYQIGAELMNRPQFFRMVSFNGSLSYDFQTSHHSFHNLTLLRLTYNRMLSTTDAFDERMAANEAIRRSFENQLIPALSYTYTWNRTSGRNRIVWQSTAVSAGNVFKGIYSLAGAHGTGKVWGNPFSQFVKGTSELKYYRTLGAAGRMTLATRLYLGAGHAYGNWPYMPYTELFTIGGANSIRAFTIRSLGPGSYVPATDSFGYLDQAGTFKAEANVELRFPIVGGLQGAVFVDAGNIWLLENDAARDGGTLTARGFLREVATGTGAGLRYDLGFFVVRVDAGVAIHAPYATTRPGYYNIPRFKDGLGLHIAIGYPF